jgi:hypothetical protein
MRNYKWGYRLDIGFIDHFNTQLVITFNYSAILNIHTLQNIRAYTKPLPAFNVFTSNCLVMASNNVYSSASGLKSFLNGGSLLTACSCSSCSPYNPSAWTTVENIISNNTSIVARRVLQRESVCLRSLLKTCLSAITASISFIGAPYLYK